MTDPDILKVQIAGFHELPGSEDEAWRREVLGCKWMWS